MATRMAKHIPNLFTLLNLFFGCVAITYILQTNAFELYYTDEGTAVLSATNSLPNAWWYGSLYIALAALVDFADGYLARLLKANSPLGAQLDSLADVVSFGVAPSMILYQMLRMAYMQQPNGMQVSILWLTPAFILACAGAYRLGRYNVEASTSTTFKGVPTPAVGLVVASFPLLLVYNTLGIHTVLLNPWVLYSIIILLSYVMVARFHMLSLKVGVKQISLKHPLPWLAAIAIVSGILLHWLAVPITFVSYIILSLIFLNNKTV